PPTYGSEDRCSIQLSYGRMLSSNGYNHPRSSRLSRRRQFTLRFGVSGGASVLYRRAVRPIPAGLARAAGTSPEARQGNCNAVVCGVGSKEDVRPSPWTTARKYLHVALREGPLPPSESTVPWATCSFGRNEAGARRPRAI